jgi:tetratricopeptide (TPR) repeat protein
MTAQVTPEKPQAAQPAPVEQPVSTARAPEAVTIKPGEPTPERVKAPAPEPVKALAPFEAAPKGAVQTERPKTEPTKPIAPTAQPPKPEAVKPTVARVEPVKPEPVKAAPKPEPIKAEIPKPAVDAVSGKSAVSAAELDRQGRALTEAGKLQEAIAVLSEAIRLKPDFAKAYNARGYAYLRKKDYVRALDDFSEAVRLDPSYTNASQNRAVAQKRLGDAGAPR